MRGTWGVHWTHTVSLSKIPYSEIEVEDIHELLTLFSRCTSTRNMPCRWQAASGSFEIKMFANIIKRQKPNTQVSKWRKAISTSLMAFLYKSTSWSKVARRLQNIDDTKNICEKMQKVIAWKVLGLIMLNTNLNNQLLIPLCIFYFVPPLHLYCSVITFCIIVLCMFTMLVPGEIHVLLFLL